MQRKNIKPNTITRKITYRRQKRQIHATEKYPENMVQLNFSDNQGKELIYILKAHNVNSEKKLISNDHLQERLLATNFPPTSRVKKNNLVISSCCLLFYLSTQRNFQDGNHQNYNDYFWEQNLRWAITFCLCTFLYCSYIYDEHILL